MSHPLWWQHNSSLVFFTPAFTWTQQFKIIQIMYRFKDYKTKPCHVMWLVRVVLLKIEQPSLLSSLPYHLEKTAMFCRKALAMDPFSSTFMNRCFSIDFDKAFIRNPPTKRSSCIIFGRCIKGIACGTCINGIICEICMKGITCVTCMKAKVY